MFKNSFKLAAVALAASASAALAGPWQTPSGTQASFDYQSGEGIMAHFGNGYGLPNGFEFFPGTLKADACHGEDVQAGDTLSVILNAKPGHAFTRITGGMLGDFASMGTTNFNGMGQLRVINLDTSYTLWSNLNFDALPAELDGSPLDGMFNGQTQLSIPAGWTNIKIEMDGLVTSYAGAESTAFINTTGANIGVETAMVPLPPALLAAIPAGVVAWRMRRKTIAAR